jgi:hypothetical protein
MTEGESVVQNDFSMVAVFFFTKVYVYAIISFSKIFLGEIYGLFRFSFVGDFITLFKCFDLCNVQ